MLQFVSVCVVSYPFAVRLRDRPSVAISSRAWSLRRRTGFLANGAQWGHCAHWDRVIMSDHEWSWSWNSDKFWRFGASHVPQIAGVAQVRHSCQDKDQQGVFCGFEAICPAQSHHCILRQHLMWNIFRWIPLVQQRDNPVLIFSGQWFNIFFNYSSFSHHIWDDDPDWLKSLGWDEGTKQFWTGYVYICYTRTSTGMLGYFIT